MRVVGTNPFIVGDEAAEGNRFFQFLQGYGEKASCYLLNTGGASEIQKSRSLPTGLHCRYLLTGNLFTQLDNLNYNPAAFTYRIATGSVSVILVDCDSSYVVWAKRVMICQSGKAAPGGSHSFGL